jgi:hypothetical protein
MKKILIILYLCLCYSCDTRYDGEVRLQFTGKVVDENNNPIQNQEVTIEANNNFINDSFHHIGIGHTDSNGNYSILVPSPTNLDAFTLHINDEFSPTYNSQLINIKYYNFKDTNFLNYKVQLPTSKLYSLIDITNLTVTFNKINANNELLDVSYIGEISSENYNLNEENIEYPHYKRVKKNQIIEIKYKVKNTTNSVISTNSSFVTIDNSDSINHSIDY